MQQSSSRPHLPKGLVKKVAIIGAGPAGLVSARYALKEGEEGGDSSNNLVPTVFERSDIVGGVWRNDDTSYAWQGLPTYFSKYICCFSELSQGAEEPLFLERGNMYKYLDLYAKKFNLYERIKFRTEVMRIEPVPRDTSDQQQQAPTKSSDSANDSNSSTPTTTYLPYSSMHQWKITYRHHQQEHLERDGSSNTSSPSQQSSAPIVVVETSEIFDAVVVASGIFAKPWYMSDEVEKLAGEHPNKVTHTSFFSAQSKNFVGESLRRPKDIVAADDGGDKEKHPRNRGEEDTAQPNRVLMVGASFSGADIAVNMCQREGVEVTAAFRKPQYVVPRLIDGLPMDAVFYRRDPVAYKRALTASSMEHWRREHSPGTARPIVEPPTWEKKHERVAKICEESWKDKPQLRVVKPNVKEPPFVTVSDGYLKMAATGRLKLKPSGVSRVEVVEKETYDDGKKVVRVTFGDNTTEEYDLVMFATGYITTLNLLSPPVLKSIGYKDTDLLQPLILYRGVISSDYPTLNFVGIYRGPFFAVMELQARWVMGLLSGRVARPSNSAMDEGLAFEREVRGREPRPQFPHGEYVAYCDLVAAELGLDLEKSPAVAQGKIELFNSPVFPQHYLLCEENPQVADWAVKVCNSNLDELLKLEEKEG